MRSSLRVCALLSAVLVLQSHPVLAESDRSLFNHAKKAEAREDYESAYSLYKQLYDRHPGDLRYRTNFQRMRFLAAAALVHKGQTLRDQGKTQEAMAAFQRAHEIDPSNFLAEQELRKGQSGAGASGGTGAAPPPKTDFLRKRAEEAAGPVELAPISNDSITLNVTDDAKAVYLAIGRLAGINVLFDPDYSSPRRVTMNLNKVTLDESLSILAIESGTFWRAVTPNTIFVAQNTPTKRRELEQNVIKTFYLSNASTQTDFQDIANTLRTVLEMSRVNQLPNLGAIVARGTPDQLALAEKIIGDLDKSRPEVVIDVAVMQVRRDKLRNLGISPPTSSSVALQPIGGTTPTTGGTTTTTGTTTPTTSNTSGLTLNDLGNLSAKNFSVSIPAATLNVLYSDANSRLIQNPQIRASDGQKASLKIGDRIPIATGSFQPGIGGVGINPLVNTQFQYQDVGVNIEITPTVHQNREVTLKLSLDISQKTGDTNIGGITQPIISQRKADHVIRLKDGEVNLLGGILEEQDVKSMSGLPGLSQIPILKYLFSSESHEKIENEIVFILIPHIVRDLEFTDLNQKAIDVGTATGIDLRRQSKAPSSQVVTPQNLNAASPGGENAAPVANPSAANAAAPPFPSASSIDVPPKSSTPQDQNPAAGPALLRLAPATLTQAMGTTFTVNVNIENAQDVYSVPMQISYSPRQLALINVSNGDFLSQGGQAVAVTHRDDAIGGTIVASASRPPGVAGVSGQGTVLTLTFKAIGTGDSVVAITRPGARNSAQQALTVLGSQATVSIR